MSKHIELNNEIMVRKDGEFFQLHKDKEAVKEFVKEIKDKTIKFNSILEKVKYMVDNDFYYNVFEQYTEDQVEDIFKKAYSYKFRFQSYMAISKFYTDYALKTDDKENYLEAYEDRCSMIALYLAKGDFTKAKRWIKSIMEQRIQPATPTTLNAGKARRGEMVSCFLLSMDDSQNSINFVQNMCGYLSKIGGGVAVNLSNLRGQGAPIKGVKGAAKGIPPVMKLLEDTFSYYDQMGQRKGSGAAYYNIFGWDIVQFLESKKINADEKLRVKTLSIGVIAPKMFFDLAEREEDLYVFCPESIQKVYGKRMTEIDFDEMYYELVANPSIRKQVVMKAHEMLNKIGQTQFESGYPYFMFDTNANKNHALKDVARVSMSNLCTEIFQLQETSEINDYEIPDVILRDISCNLASMNTVNVMESKKLKETVYDGMDMLTAVSDMTDVSNAPSVKKANREMHSVGLGIMNLHGYLAKNMISYESKEARDFVRAFGMAINFYSIERSMQIAKETGIKFTDFDRSEYAKGTYFNMYLDIDFRPVTDKVKGLFEGIPLPTIADWTRLKAEVMEHGLYHAYRLATAPTQSIAYIQNSTPSVMPIVDVIETRTYANSKTYFPMPFLDEMTQFMYKSAYDIDQFKLIDLISELQRHVDQGISTILYVNSNTSTRQLARYYIYAQEKGLKSLYYTRTKKLSVEECTACQV